MVDLPDGVTPQIRLSRVTTPIELGIAICESTRAHFHVSRCIVALYAADGRPSMTFDNAPHSDADRLQYIAVGWLDDPLLRALRDHHAPASVADEEGESLLVPILGLGELVGSIRCSHPKLSRSQRRDLPTFASYVSVRVAQLGIASTPDPLLARLTTRQREVARQAASGRSNAEIGAVLAISGDTVKKHLKDIYSRLGVTTRTELAAQVRPDVPRSTVPIGVTRVGDIAITRANLSGLDPPRGRAPR